MSGTAAKLGPKSAYHHCTVLVDVNECVLHDALSSKAVNKLCKNNKVFHEAILRLYLLHLIPLALTHRILQVNVESRATQSVRVPVQNLAKYDPLIFNVSNLQVCYVV